MASYNRNSDLEPILFDMETAFTKEDAGAFKKNIGIFEELIFDGDWVIHETSDPPNIECERVECITDDGFSYITRTRYVRWDRMEGDENNVAKYRKVKRMYRTYDGGLVSDAIRRISMAFEHEDRVTFDDMIYFLRYTLELAPEPDWIESEGLKPSFRHPRQLVEMRLRDGYVFSQFVELNTIPDEDGLRWDIRDLNSDILHYRPLPTL